MNPRDELARKWQSEANEASPHAYITSDKRMKL